MPADKRQPPGWYQLTMTGINTATIRGSGPAYELFKQEMRNTRPDLIIKEANL